MGYGNQIEIEGYTLQLIECDRRREGKLRVMGARVVGFGDRGRLETDGTESRISYEVSWAEYALSYGAFSTHYGEVRIEGKKLDGERKARTIYFADMGQGELLALQDGSNLMAIGLWPAMRLGQELFNGEHGVELTA